MVRSPASDATYEHDPIDGPGDRVAWEIRRLIRDRQLLPGEPIRQQEMAERVGTSRVPVREALRVLQTEGILQHTHHKGYVVAKFSANELNQIYLMRHLLETALLREIEWPDADRLAVITELNRKIAAAADDGDVTSMVELNRHFHDMIFGSSRLQLLHREVRRLWSISDSYRALYLYGRSARAKIADEHETILARLRAHDLEGLLAALDAHREQAQTDVVALLG